ncbi:MAG TPA: outer membrane protein assembly factor BamD [Rhabdochlamydiaceae bacterium]|jgi:outer membrane protein assembly factor BamD (BamD/ComL family)|nr:outer membrane protein assembly factor BamD [Rhabdochlamydiaceae bacterium]
MTKKWILATVLLWLPLFSAYTIKDGKVRNVEEVATMSVQEHYGLLLEAVQNQRWEEVIQQATIMVQNFPDSPFYQESFYFLGLGFFHKEDFEIANQYLTTYLKKQTALQHFREAIELKFQIADRFGGGYKKHLGGVEFLPRWMPAKEEAIEIYDEVINALPNDDLAAKALFGKGKVILDNEEYSSSIEVFQTLIRRFPKHALAPDAYIEIGKVYLIESKERYPDVDFLDLATLNLKKFRQDFPSDERIETAENILAEMQEVYAKSFYDIAKFYERTKKPHASILYYSKIIKAFPNTKSADLSKKRLSVLRPPQEEIQRETGEGIEHIPNQEQVNAIEPVAEPEIAVISEPTSI